MTDSLLASPLVHPAALQRALSRRGFLLGLAAAAVGSVAGCGLPAGSTPDLDDLTIGRPDGWAPSGAPRSGGGPPTPHTPFTLTVDSHLSEDYFPLQVYSIDPVNDVVAAYSRNDGEVEAMLLQKRTTSRVGGITQVYRDPSQPGGWNNRSVPNTAGATDMVAGMAGPTAWNATDGPKSLHVWYRQGDQVLHVVEDDQGNWSSVGAPLAWPDTAGALQLSYTDDDLLVYCVQESSGYGGSDAVLHYDFTKSIGSPSGSLHLSGSVSGFEFHTTAPSADYKGKWQMCATMGVLAETAVNEIQMTIGVLKAWVPTRNTLTEADEWPGLMYLAWGLTPDGKTSASYDLSKGFAQQMSYWGTHGLAGPIASIDFLVTTRPGQFFNLDNATGPDFGTTLAVLRTTSNTLYVATQDGSERWANVPDQAWYMAPITLPPAPTPAPPALQWASSLTPSQEVATTPLLELFVQAGETTHVIRPTDVANPDSNLRYPAFYPPVPLLTGISVVASQAAPSRGNELIVVGKDGTLRYLVRDPSSGAWTGSPIHLTASEPLQVSTYRVRFSLTDAWGSPVSGAALAVSTYATPIAGQAAQQPSPAIGLVSGQAQVLSGTPTTITTGVDGTVVLAVVATGTSAPPLLVATPNLSSSLPSPFVVHPSEPINAYLGGSGTLNTLPVMSAGTLTGAKTASGATLMPNASVTPAGQSQSNAAMAIGVLGQASAAGAPRAAGTRRRPSKQLARLGKPRGSLPTLRVRGLEVSWSSLADDVLFGIKSGALAVTGMKLLNGLFTVFTDVASAVASFAIHTLEDAANAFHSVINYLGAEISAFLDWLKAQILSVLTDSVAVAQTLNSQITDCLIPAVKKWMTTYQKDVDSWVSGEAAAVQAFFDNAADKLAGYNLNGDKPTAFGRSRPGRGAAAGDDTGAATSGPANWFMDKIRALEKLAPSLAGPAPSLPDDFAKAFTDAKGDFSTAAGDIETSIKNIAADILHGFENPKQMLTTSLPDIVRQLGTLVAGIFKGIEGIIDAAFALIGLLLDAISDLLQVKMTDIPVIGKLIGTPLTLGELGCLFFAFPFVVAWKIAKSGQPVPFTKTTANVPRGSSTTAPFVVPGPEGFNFLGAVITGVVGINDALAAGLPTISGVPTPIWMTAIDLGGGLAVTYCQYPFVSTDYQVQTFPALSTNADRLNVANWLTDAFSPLIAGLALFIELNTENKLDLLKPLTDNIIPALYGITGHVSNGIGLGWCSAAGQAAPIWVENFMFNLGSIATILTSPIIEDEPFGPLAKIAAVVTIGASAGVAAGLMLAYPD